MKKHLIVTALCAAMALPAAAEDVTGDTVVATVNGTDITMTHVMDIRRQLPEQYQDLPASVLFTGIVDQLIQQRVLAGSIQTDPDWLDEVLENQRASALAGIAVRDASNQPVSEDDVRDAYEAQFNSAAAKEFNASHILVETEEEAQALVEQLNGGADFAELAQEFSTGPSGPRGGELGWFGLGMMVPPFEEAVTQMDSGAVSAPVQTQFGWHVIKLNDVRTGDIPAFEDVRADIEGTLRSEKLNITVEALMGAATVDKVEGIDPEVLNTLDVFGQ
ncbi:MAG: peptidylprolyl isomerase [Pseudomonadota bacterium]